MIPTVEEFNTVFPEFANEDEKKLEYYLIMNKNAISEAVFGDQYNHAVYLRTAHDLTMKSALRAGKGEVNSERAGDLAVGYASAGSPGDKYFYLSQTQYGKEYLEIMNSRICGITIVDNC
jgi:hypothetical protein